MKREDAARVLANYRASVEQAQNMVRTQVIWSKERRAALQAANEMVPYVNAVLREMLPDVAPICGGYVKDHVANLGRLNGATALFAAWKAIVVAGPDGGEVVPPYLPFAAMDPIVSSAASLWEKSKYRQAVSDAAGRLNKLTQERMGVHDLSDYNLMAMAFDPKPPQKRRPRLRCPRNLNPDTVRSMQEGPHRIAMGCMMAIRNPSTHETGDGNPVTCAEQLATLSMVARWVRNWTVDRYVEPINIDVSHAVVAYQKNLARQRRLAGQLPQEPRTGEAELAPVSGTSVLDDEGSR